MSAVWWRGLVVVGGVLLLAGAPLPVGAGSSPGPAFRSAPPPAAVGMTWPHHPVGRPAVAWPSLTQLTVTPNPAQAGGLVTISARVTSDTIPVTMGAVTFADFGGSRITVPLGPDGTAALSYGFDDPGLYPITATFDGTAEFASSGDTVDLGVDPVAQVGGTGTFVIAQGGTLGLTAAGSTGGGTIDWDLNGDGDFTDATGTTSEVGWDRLQDLGIDVGPARAITVRNTVNGRSATGVARLVVTNTAPAVVVPGDQNAVVGQQVTLTIGADDPSAGDAAAGFTYTVDWGDGSVPEPVSGTGGIEVTHRFSAAGAFPVSVRATDQHGGTGSAQVRVVVVAVTSTSTSTGSVPAAPTAGAAAPSSPATLLVAAVVRSSPDSADPPDDALADTGTGVARAVLLGCAMAFAGGALIAGARVGRGTRFGRGVR